ncbi:hypothetical protein GCM10027160_10320 [Streptomyces calidiresistens]
MVSVISSEVSSVLTSVSSPAGSGDAEVLPPGAQAARTIPVDAAIAATVTRRLRRRPAVLAMGTPFSWWTDAGGAPFTPGGAGDAGASGQGKTAGRLAGGSGTRRAKRF